MTTKRDRPGFAKLNLTTRSTQVREQLEKAIRSGEYPSGSHLPSERELTEMFGVSRVSVREALRSLEALGFVEVKHGAKTTVVDPSQRVARDLGRWMKLNRGEVFELLNVRGALDALAGQEASARRGDSELDRLRAAHDAFAEAAESGTSDRLAELDLDFHVAVAEASGSTLLRDLLVELHEHMAETRAVFFQPADRAKVSATEHGAILTAIEDGDAAAAKRATDTHIASVREVMEQI